jgi:hypothetical protein
MRCTRVEKFLPLYVAGDLAGRRAERHIARHLATCERCRGLAEEYDASRDFARAAAATLPPDFDGAFYAELRRSVLSEITRERTRLAPPHTFAGFASLFNPRFAYAASVALLLVAVAALSLHSYVNRKSDIAKVTDERNVTPAATPVSTKPTASSDRRTVAPVEKTVAENTGAGSRQPPKPLPSKRRADGSSDAQNETRRSPNVANNAPAYARRNPLAPVVAARDERTEQVESSNSGGAETAAPEVSRIEIQTSDPNIRIIWLSPRPDADVAQPLK